MKDFRPEWLSYDLTVATLDFALTTNLAIIVQLTLLTGAAPSLTEVGQTAARIPLPAQAVPASLHASLMARLDRLGDAKDVTQIGAAIGREFSHPLLEAVAGKPEARAPDALDRALGEQYAEAGIVKPRQVGKRRCA